jgi:hypothetical protein
MVAIDLERNKEKSKNGKTNSMMCTALHDCKGEDASGFDESLNGIPRTTSLVLSK